MKHKQNYRKDFNKKSFRKKSFGRHDFYLEGCPEGVKVPDSSTYSLERAMKYLKRQLKDSEKIMRYKSKKEYIKPSAIRRKQKEDAIRKEKYQNSIRDRVEKNYVWTAMTERGAR